MPSHTAVRRSPAARRRRLSLLPPLLAGAAGACVVFLFFVCAAAAAQDSGVAEAEAAAAAAMAAAAGGDGVDASGWATANGSPASPRALSAAEKTARERDLAAEAEAKTEAAAAEENPWPELDWPRAGGPIFDPAGGMYKDSVDVLVYSLMGSGATLHYTTDGSTPTNRSAQFETKLHFEGIGDYVVKAIVAADQKRDSVVSEQVYHIRGDAAAPAVTARQVDTEGLGLVAANMTGTNAQYLGSFEEAVALSFYTSTPNCDVRFTLNGDAVTEASNATGPSLALTLRDVGNFTVRTRSFPRNASGFPSQTAEYFVEVHPRPPTPAFSARRDKRFVADMVAKFRDGVKEKEGPKVLYPPELAAYITSVLNPDDGKCGDCTVTEAEQREINKGAARMKVQEGLHVDDQIELHEGFLTRGSCRRFVRDLNKQMREYRWAVRNATLAAEL